MKTLLKITVSLIMLMLFFSIVACGASIKNYDTRYEYLIDYDKKFMDGIKEIEFTDSEYKDDMRELILDGVYSPVEQEKISILGEKNINKFFSLNPKTDIGKEYRLLLEERYENLVLFYQAERDSNMDLANLFLSDAIDCLESETDWLFDNPNDY